MMKKFLKIAMAFVLTATLVGCANNNQETKTATKPITFYVVRHGETLFNQRGIAQGWCDAPLTEEGINQAKALGESLKDVEFTAAYSSVSERAMDTGNYALGGRNIQLQLTEDLKEMNFGSLEGESNKVLWSDPKRMTEGFVDVGGENFEILSQRAKKALDQAATSNQKTGGNILISTHGMTAVALISTLGADEYAKFMAEGGSELDNCSVSLIEWDDGNYKVKTINDTSYRDNGLKALKK